MEESNKKKEKLKTRIRQQRKCVNANRKLDKDVMTEYWLLHVKITSHSMLNAYSVNTIAQHSNGNSQRHGLWFSPFLRSSFLPFLRNLFFSSSSSIRCQQQFSSVSCRKLQTISQLARCASKSNHSVKHRNIYRLKVVRFVQSYENVTLIFQPNTRTPDYVCFCT